MKGPAGGIDVRAAGYHVANCTHRVLDPVVEKHGTVVLGTLIVRASTQNSGETQCSHNTQAEREQHFQDGFSQTWHY